jgi:pyruvate/2-oxoglutarate dehydrogenase complex dihydrolipoamide dehydrogenase (E3) component
MPIKPAPKGEAFMQEPVDVIVIGMGPGGESVAGQLAEAGLSVLGIEKELVGGECPYWGCVPSKMMIRAADLLAEAHRIPGIAGQASVTPDWEPVARRIREQATDNWDDRVAVERFERKGGHFVRGAGRIEGPGTVSVAGKIYAASRGIVIATGTSPSIPPIPGLDRVPYWINRQAIEAETLPASLVVLGGGSVGLELGQVFARFGVKVSVVEAHPRLMPMEEPEAGEELARVLGSEGIDIHVDARAIAVEEADTSIAVNLEGVPRVVGERLLVATGRSAKLADLGLETVGIEANRRWVEVDSRMRAGPGVWAVGDVTGHGAFTHVAVYQAAFAVADILGKDGPGADYTAVPRVTFTDPEVGAVGLTENQAAQRGLRVRTGLARVSTSARGWIHGPGNDGFIKLVEDVDRGVLVGATSVGPRGGDVLGLLELAVHARVPVEQLRSLIYAYPSFYRGVQDALRVLEAAPANAPVAA